MLTPRSTGIPHNSARRCTLSLARLLVALFTMSPLCCPFATSHPANPGLDPTAKRAQPSHISIYCREYEVCRALSFLPPALRSSWRLGLRCCSPPASTALHTGSLPPTEAGQRRGKPRDPGRHDVCLASPASYFFLLFAMLVAEMMRPSRFDFAQYRGDRHFGSKYFVYCAAGRRRLWCSPYLQSAQPCP